MSSELTTAARLDGVKGVILAGTYPRGNSVFDHLRPRPLLPVALTPLVAYPLRWLWEGGVPTATVCTNNAARAVHTLLSGVRELPIELDFYEDVMPRGSAGCVRDAALRSGAHTFVVADGTAIPCVDLPALIETHRAHGAALTVVAHGQASHGPGEPWLVPAGIYVFDRATIEAIPERGFQDIKETIIPHLHETGAAVAVHTGEGACPRIFNTETYLAVSHWMVSQVMAQAAGVESQGYRMFDETLAHGSVWIAPSARLVGPILLAPQVVIAEGATIVGPTTIGPGSRVGAGALVSRSVLWDSCGVGPQAVLDQCLVADEGVVPPGATFYSALQPRAQATPRKDTVLALPEGAITSWNGAMFPFRPPTARNAA